MCKYCKERFNVTKDDSISKKLRQIYRNLFYNLQNEIIVSKEINNLEEILLNKDFTESDESSIVRFLLNNNMLNLFQSSYELFENNLEINFSNELLSKKKDIFNYSFYNRFEELIKNEINLANINECDKVLFIGSGYFPISSILFNKYTNCKVDCYDNNNEAVLKSKEVIDILNLNDSIRIYNKDGRELKDNHYDIVVIALLAKPKNEILSNLGYNLSSNIKIICRNSYGLRQAFYENTSKNLLSQYNLKDIIYAKGNQTISSVLLMKE